ncbi:MAG: hypothetical protein R3C14_39825 [Caldilineaceae bacterium]
MAEKSLLTKLGEAVDQHRAERKATTALSATTQEIQDGKRYPRWWLHFLGNTILTLLLMSGLLWAQNHDVIALFAAPNGQIASTGALAYQGRLADASGNPLTNTVNMTFRLYAAASGGSPLWEEQWTGANSVQVSDGLFNVMLGSLTPIPQTVITGNSNLFLGITVGTDSEMSPRVQLGSVPFTTQALTVPDGSITSEKLADGAVTSAKLEAGNLTNLSILQSNVVANVQSAQVGNEKSVAVNGFVDLHALSIQVQETATLRISYQALVWKSGSAGRTALGIRVDGSANSAAHGNSWVQVGTPVSSLWTGESRQLANTWFVTVPSGSHTISLVLGSWDGGTSHAQVYSINVETLKSP